MPNIARKLVGPWLILAVFCGGVTLLSPAPLRADDHDDGGRDDAAICIGSHSGSSFKDLVVPRGQTCQLDRFNVVNGDIKVRKGASLIVCPDNDIRGDIKAHKPDTVLITDLTIAPCAPVKALGITIGGDVKVNHGVVFRLFGNPGGVAVIEGDVEVRNTETVEIQFFNNSSRINGDVEVKNSRDVTVTDNIVGGDLRIRGTSGSCVEQNNSVAGNLDTCP